MGTTLCNLNVYNLEKKDYDPGKEYLKVNITEDWDTILENDDDHDFDRICKLAASLSRSLDTNIVATTYFDDDIFDLEIYSSGKKKAFYHTGYDKLEVKNASAMVSMLDLDATDAKAFRYLLKKGLGAGYAISSFSALAGLPFYVEKYMYEHMPDKIIPDKEAVLKEIEREKAKIARKPKFDNTAELLCEIPGIAVDQMIEYGDEQKGVVRVVEPSEGEIDYGHIHCYQINAEKEPSLQQIHDYKLPYKEWAPRYEPRALANMGDWIDLFDNRECVVHEFGKKEDIKAVIAMGEIPGDKFIPTKYEALVKKWIYPYKLPFNPGNEKLLEGVDPRSSFFDMCRNEVMIENGLMIHIGAYCDYRNKKQYIVVDFFTEDREYQKTYFIPIDLDFAFYSISADYLYIEEKQQIILGEYIIDLKNKTFTVSDTLSPDMQYVTRRKLRDGKEVLIVQSSRAFFVYDMDYKLLLSKSVKGSIIAKMIDDEDNILVITSDHILALGCSYDLRPKDKVKLYRIPLVTG